VYGPEEIGGPVMQRFGPISGLAGRRRLNVLFSRAKMQIVTFSSMTAADINAEVHANPGAYMLKCWLEYTATGKLHSGETQGSEPDSEFEVYVINQLRAMGFEPVPQVGVAGFRIDIGVRHPSWPHGFIMGVECDGATYHSSRSARDRDRLREQVLRNLGWELHRIWSTDWFSDPAREASRLREAIATRLNLLQRETLAERPSDLLDQDIDDGVADIASEGQVTQTSPSEGGQKVPPPAQTMVPAHTATTSIEVGDTVRVVYLDDERFTRQVTLSDTRNVPAQGIVHMDEPLGVALIGAEEGDEVEILVGNSVRMVLVEKITKGHVAQGSDRVLTSSPVSPTPIMPQRDLFRSRPPGTTAATILDPDRFYDVAYLPTLISLSCDFVDRLAPITFRRLSELVARAHGFQRTGSQIKSQVWSATFKRRPHSRDKYQETIFWPDGKGPAQVVAFRGMTIGGERRDWSHIPHPEKLGLALDILASGRGDFPSLMAQRIGFARLRQTTRTELELLLEEAQDIGKA